MSDARARGLGHRWSLTATPRPATRFALALVVGLGLVTWIAFVLVQNTTHRWFEKDVALRSQLAVRGASAALIPAWRSGRTAEIQDVLGGMTLDERIISAIACDADSKPLAAAGEMPDGHGCREIAPHVRASANAPAAEWRLWNEIVTTPEGRLAVSAVPVIDGSRALGFVALEHDLGFVGRRDATTRRFLLIAFAVLAIAASAVTVGAARVSRQGWVMELRTLLRGAQPRPEWQPLMRDVRDLVDRLVADRDTEREGGSWTPDRLKQTLNRYLHGEKLVVLSNREPYIHERASDGETISVVHPASGLVTALEPVMRACSGTWIAHGGGSADRETVDHKDRIRVPPGDESYVIRRVWLTPEEERGYYYGFSNEGLWPLCHVAHARPVFRSEDWAHYKAVNQRFADALCEEVDSTDPIILVQDYHLALAPRLIRERLPQATILTFWHIPWANSQTFGICPWREELLEGMLGSSILGFHTRLDCNWFIDSVDRFLEARIDREQSAVIQRGHATLVRAYPISIEWPVRWAQMPSSIEACRARVLRDCGLKDDALIGVGVDRLDYTKGIEERLLAVERFLERFPKFRGRFTFVQLAAPSRTLIERYRQLHESLTRIAARVNERFGSGDYRPIILKDTHHEPPVVFQYYRAADICYVSSLHDGMNLVAKEFVAARDDEQGVLVLSQFTGAARELTEALVVNPYDLEEASTAFAVALEMSPEEKRERMRSMRALVAELNVYRWAGRMLTDAARLRRRERLTGRLSDRNPLRFGS